MASPSTTPTTVLITGGGGGLGKAIATAFLASGANVSVCDVSASRLAAAEREWAALAGPGPDGAAPRVLTTTADVTDEAAVEALVAATAARFGGRLDVLVNNAGVMDGFSPVGTCTREAWDRVMGVNLLGPFHMCRAAIAQFERQGAGEGEGEGVGVGGPRGGVIVNICSVAAKLGSVAGVAYTASKHALLGLSKNTAFNYADKGIYSVALILGGMETNISDGMARGVDAEALQRFMAAHMAGDDPRRNIVPVEDVARYVVFVSDRSIAKSANGSAVELTNNWPAA